MQGTTPSRADVLTTAQSLIREELPDAPADMAEQTRLQDIPDATSIKIMRVAMRAESHYGVTIITPDATIAETVGEFADQIARALAASA